MGASLQLVGERRELGRLAAASVRERLGEQPVGEPGLRGSSGP